MIDRNKLAIYHGADGIFKELGKLNYSDQYTLELGNGTMLKYEVVGKLSINAKGSISIMFSQEPNISKPIKFGK